MSVLTIIEVYPLMGGQLGAVLQEQFKMVGSHSRLGLNKMTRKELRVCTHPRTHPPNYPTISNQVLSARATGTRNESSLRGRQMNVQMPYELKSQRTRLACNKIPSSLKKKVIWQKMSAQHSKEQKKRMHLSKNNREREAGATNR